LENLIAFVKGNKKGAYSAPFALTSVYLVNFSRNFNGFAGSSC
jgi:hypothetical protein